MGLCSLKMTIMLVYDHTQNLLTIILPQGKTTAELVKMLVEELKGLNAKSGFCGSLIKITGACPVILGFALSHHVSHLFGTVAVFEPKLNNFVVCISHSPAFKVGDIIE